MHRIWKYCLSGIGMTLAAAAMAVPANAQQLPPLPGAPPSYVSAANAALPGAEAQVAAVQSNSAALNGLYQKWLHSPFQGNGLNPQDFALGIALSKFITTLSDGSPNNPATPGVAAGDPCWYVGSHIWKSQKWYWNGIKVADVAENHPYWCGNGSSITQNGLTFYQNNWVQSPPYCLNVSGQAQGWDAPNYAWAHAHVFGNLGVIYPWGCGTFSGAWQGLRINGAGGYDGYNDF